MGTTTADPKIIEHVDDEPTTIVTPTAEVETAVVEPIAPDLPLDVQAALNLVAVAKVIEEDAKKVLAAARGLLTQHLAHEHAKSSGKTYVAKMAGVPVGTATIPEAQDKDVVTSPTQFLEWVESHREWSEQVELVKRVRPAFESLILKDVEWVKVKASDSEADGEESQPEVDLSDPWAAAADRLPESRWTDPATGQVYMAIYRPTGEPVPGITLIPGQVDVSTFRFVFTKPKKGASKVEDNQRTGRQIVADELREQGYEHFVADMRARGILSLES